MHFGHCSKVTQSGSYQAGSCFSKRCIFGQFWWTSWDFNIVDMRNMQLPPRFSFEIAIIIFWRNIKRDGHMLRFAGFCRGFACSLDAQSESCGVQFDNELWIIWTMNCSAFHPVCHIIIALNIPNVKFNMWLWICAWWICAELQTFSHTTIDAVIRKGGELHFEELNKFE